MPDHEIEIVNYNFYMFNGVAKKGEIYVLDEQTTILELECIVAMKKNKNIIGISFSKDYISVQHTYATDMIKNYKILFLLDDRGLSTMLHYRPNVYITKASIDHVVTKYKYNYPIVLNFTIKFTFDFDVHAYINNPDIVNEKYSFDIATTFQDVENIVTQKIMDLKIVDDKSQITIQTIYDSYKYTKTGRASGSYSKRDISITFCKENASDYTNQGYINAYGTNTCEKSVYMNVPILNRFETGDTITVLVNVVKNGFIKIYHNASSFINQPIQQDRYINLNYYDGLERKKVDMKNEELMKKYSSYILIDKNLQIDEIIKHSNVYQNKIIDIRKIIIKHNNKILNHLDTIHTHLFDNDKIEFKIMDEPVPEKNTEIELSNKATKLLKNMQIINTKNFTYLYENINKIYDMTINLTNDLETTNYNISLSMVLLQTDIVDENLFILWIKNKTKYMDTKNNTMEINTSNKPFDQYTWEQNNSAVSFLIRYIYNSIDYENMSEYIKNLSCVKEWCQYFGFHKFNNFFNDDFIIEYTKRFQSIA